MKVLITSALLLSAFLGNAQIGGGGNPEPNASKQPQTSAYAKEKLTYKVIKDSDAWKVNIYVNDKLLLSQSTIPGRQGKNNLKSKGQAEKCGHLLIEKLRSNKPLTISDSEYSELSSIN